MPKKYQARLSSRFKRKTPLLEEQPVHGGAAVSLQVKDLNHQGQGVASLHGKKVFINDALPSERVLAGIYAETAGVLQANTLQLESASEFRQSPPCAHFGDCGGCALQHCQPEQQLLYKKQQLIKAFKVLDKAPKPKAPKLGQRPVKAESSLGFDLANTSTLTASAYGYRRRARLGLSHCGQLGFRQRGSNNTIAIQHCSVLTEVLQQALLDLNLCLRETSSLLPSKLSWPQLIGHIELIDANPGPVAIVRHTGAIKPEIVTKFEQLDGFQVIWQPQATPPDTILSYGLEPGLDLAFGLGDFIQVNAELNQKMVDQAIEWLQLQGTERVLDLFCGIGNFSLPLARRVESVLGIEVSEQMVAKATANLKANGIKNARFMVADLEYAASQEPLRADDFDTVLLDPPRAGAAGIMPFLAKLKAARIVYVSCNPSTLVRDARVLLAAGYKLRRLSAMDMFPNTAHLEAMALFERA